MVVLRFGPGRLLLDTPSLGGPTDVASIWIADDPPVWQRAVWPHDGSFGLPIAPLDLSPGQIIEVSSCDRSAVPVRYACVLDANDSTLVVLCTGSVMEALAAGAQIHRAWRDAHLQHAFDRLRRRG